MRGDDDDGDDYSSYDGDDNGDGNDDGDDDDDDGDDDGDNGQGIHQRTRRVDHGLDVNRGRGQEEDTAFAKQKIET